VRAHLLDCCSGPHAGAAAVLLDSSAPRAFSAGGDVKSARAAVLEAPYSDAPPAGHHIHRVFQVRARRECPRVRLGVALGCWLCG
jgi:enoyl-CoA hydratase/carnithine racemase